MSVTKNIRGYWVISEVVDGYLEQRTYIGYTRKEAIAMFKLEVLSNG
jgi:hypothetical protein